MNGTRVELGDGYYVIVLTEQAGRQEARLFVELRSESEARVLITSSAQADAIAKAFAQGAEWLRGEGK